ARSVIDDDDFDFKFASIFEHTLDDRVDVFRFVERGNDDGKTSATGAGHVAQKFAFAPCESSANPPHKNVILPKSAHRFSIANFPQCPVVTFSSPRPCSPAASVPLRDAFLCAAGTELSPHCCALTDDLIRRLIWHGSMAHVCGCVF